MTELRKCLPNKPIPDEMLSQSNNFKLRECFLKVRIEVNSNCSHCLIVS